MPNTKPLQNKTALVTGASKGIGKAAALKLARDGAFVIVNYATDASGAAAAVAQIEKEEGRAIAIQGDISNLASIKTLFADVDAALKKEGFTVLNILVNNAGIYPVATFENTTEEEFDKTFNVNVKGLFFTSQEAVKRMTNGGRIINISTALTRFATDSMIAYAASKGAVDLLTRDMAKSLGPKGITVNAVNPGLIRTEGTSFMTQDNTIVTAISGDTALGRVGEPDDIAGVVAFLANDNARWVTAQTIEASGGYHL